MSSYKVWAIKANDNRVIVIHNIATLTIGIKFIRMTLHCQQEKDTLLSSWPAKGNVKQREAQNLCTKIETLVKYPK